MDFDVEGGYIMCYTILGIVVMCVDNGIVMICYNNGIVMMSDNKRI